jgi:hypothetical protein
LGLTGKELHHHVEVLVVLEGVVQRDDPGVVGHGEHVPLRADVADLVLADHGLLDHGLERVHLAVGLLLHEPHLPERPPPDDHQGIEVLGGETPPLLPLILRLHLLQLLAISLPLRVVQVEPGLSPPTHRRHGRNVSARSIAHSGVI